MGILWRIGDQYIICKNQLYCTSSRTEPRPQRLIRPRVVYNVHLSWKWQAQSQMPKSNERSIVNWTNFELFKRRSTTLWIITIAEANWQKGSCTCPRYQQTFKCKHIMGVALRQRYAQAPQQPRMFPSDKSGSGADPRKPLKCSSLNNLFKLAKSIQINTSKYFDCISII